MTTEQQREQWRIRFARRWARTDAREKIIARRRAAKRKPPSAAQLARKAAEQRKYRKDPVLRERHDARRAVRVAIEAGKLAKGACSVCGTHDKIEAHHDDYSKPLEVRWLCRHHHKRLHHGH